MLEEPRDHVQGGSDAELATQIIVALIATRPLELEQLPDLILRIRTALAAPVAGLERSPDDQGPVARQGRAVADGSRPPRDAGPVPPYSPAVSVADSITPDFLISLEDGRPYRSLKRHLMAKHGLTPDEYRRKWGLPSDYPMVAPNYATERSAVAKRIGLGKSGPAPKARLRSPRKTSA